MINDIENNIDFNKENIVKIKDKKILKLFTRNKHNEPNQFHNNCCIDIISNIFNATDNYFFSVTNETKLFTTNSYIDIYLYNCIKKQYENFILYDSEKLDKIVDSIINYHEISLNVCLTMSSFQFIGLFLQNNDVTQLILTKFAYFILSIGFVVSMFCIFINYLITQYLKSIKNENTEFIIIGINKYKNLFNWIQLLIFFNCICFILPLNILIYSNIGFYFGIIFNVISFLLLFFSILLYYQITIRKQIYENVNGDSYKRKIY